LLFRFHSSKTPYYCVAREAFSLKPVLIVYNAFLVALNTWITYELVMGFILDNMNFTCNQVNTEPSNQPSMRVRCHQH